MTAQQNCPYARKIVTFWVYSEPNQGGGRNDDDTAMNGFGAQCEGGEIMTYTGNNWGSMSAKHTSNDGFKGFNLKVEGNQGGGCCKNDDDTGLNDLSLGTYNSGTFIGGGANTAWGSWSAASYCPSGQYFCGFRTKNEGPQVRQTVLSLSCTSAKVSFVFHIPAA
jgi:hypothetical protein